MNSVLNLKVKSLLKWTILFVVFFSCTGYALGPVFDYDYYPVMVFILVLTLLLSEMKLILPNSRTLLIYIIFMFSFLLTAVYNFEYLTIASFYIPFLLMTSAVFVTTYISLQTFAKFFIRAITLISIVSILFFIISVNFGNIFNLSIITNPNGTSYYNGLLFFISTETLRISGTFWEPGIFASFIFLGLIFNEYFVLRYKEITRIILLLSLLVTASTAAYFLFFIYIFLIFTKNVKKTYTTILLFLLFLILTMITTIYFDQILDFLIKILPDIFNKLKSGTTDNKSVMARLISFQAFWEVFISRWLIGYGFMNAEIKYSLIMQDYGLLTNTATSLYYLAALGVPGVLYTLLFIIGIISVKEISNLQRFILIFSLLFILNKEPHLFSMITYILLFYSIKKTKKSKFE